MPSTQNIEPLLYLNAVTTAKVLCEQVSVRTFLLVDKRLDSWFAFEAFYRSNQPFSVIVSIDRATEVWCDLLQSLNVTYYLLEEARVPVQGEGESKETINLVSAVFPDHKPFSLDGHDLRSCFVGECTINEISFFDASEGLQRSYLGYIKQRTKETVPGFLNLALRFRAKMSPADFLRIGFSVTGSHLPHVLAGKRQLQAQGTMSRRTFSEGLLGLGMTLLLPGIAHSKAGRLAGLKYLADRYGIQDPGATANSSFFIAGPTGKNPGECFDPATGTPGPCPAGG